MSDNNNNDGFFEMLDTAVEFYEDNKDTFKGIFDEGSDVTIDGEEPLKQARVDEDMATVAVDVGTNEIEDIRLNLNGTDAVIGIGDKTITAEVPVDVKMDEAEAILNNGILEVKIPREGGED